MSEDKLLYLMSLTKNALFTRLNNTWWLYEKSRDKVRRLEEYKRNPDYIDEDIESLQPRKDSLFEEIVLAAYIIEKTYGRRYISEEVREAITECKGEESVNPGDSSTPSGS